MDILALLEAKGIKWVPKGGDEISIICPNAGQHQDGKDSVESFNINTVKLKSNCFACGFRLNEVGLTKWLLGEDIDESQLRSLKLKASMKRVKEDRQLTLVEGDSVEVLFPSGELWEEDYRGISAETYKLLGAIHCTRGRYADRICFPINVDGKLLGVDARTLLPEVLPKYLRNYGSSCKDSWIYPFDVVKGMRKNYAILGEGIFHAVNGVDKGFPAIAYFGSNNWSNSKVMKLLDLNIQEVIYFRDEDKAGKKAEQWVCASLAPWFDVFVIADGAIPAGRDLGDLAKEEIEFALSSKVKPRHARCLVDKPWGGTKVVFGNTCYDKRCSWCVKGKCINDIGG